MNENSLLSLIFSDVLVDDDFLNPRNREKRGQKLKKTEEGEEGEEVQQHNDEDDETRKKKSDDLWASFLSDVGAPPKSSQSAPTAQVKVLKV